jgi:hypothetical protein
VPPESEFTRTPAGGLVNPTLARERLAGVAREDQIVRSLVGELEAWNLSFKVDSPFAGKLRTFTPLATERYILRGYVVTAQASTQSLAKAVIAVSYDPAVSTMATSFTRKTTLLRLTFPALVQGIQTPYNFPAGFGLAFRPTEPLHFLAACDAPAPAKLTGSITLYVEKVVI